MEALDLRSAVEDDAPLLFEWRNHPQTRANSFDSNPVAWDEHIRWFRSALRDPRRLILVGEVEGRAVGVIRFERSNDRAEVSVTVQPGHRGQGYGRRLISSGSSLCRQRWQIPIDAYIKASNTTSIRAFSAAGYLQIEQTASVTRMVLEGP